MIILHQTNDKSLYLDQMRYNACDALQVKMKIAIDLE